MLRLKSCEEKGARIGCLVSMKKMPVCYVTALQTGGCLLLKQKTANRASFVVIAATAER